MEFNFDLTVLIAERKIQEAMEAGEFDNLPGKGEPLRLDENPFEPIHQRVANRILKNARALPEWLQLEKDIAREAGQIQPARSRALRAFHHMRNPAVRARIAERFRAEHRERLDVLNTLILRYNEVAPVAARRVFLPYSLPKEMAALDAEFAQAEGSPRPAP